MNKGTHFIGQPMYGQLISLLDKSKILKISREKGGERYVKHFDAWQHLVIMLYAVIKRFDSLREITDSMFPEARKFSHLGPAAAPFLTPTPEGRKASSRRPIGTCMPPTRTSFPRTAGNARLPNGLAGCKSSTPRPSRSSRTSYSRAWAAIRRQERRRAA